MTERKSYTIFDNIEGEMARNHVSQEELAKALGINRSTYRYWRKKNDMPIKKLIEISDYLGCTLDTLARNVR